jgi:hypothetical protein
MSGAPPSTYGRPSVAYVTPSRRATRTALSNSSSALFRWVGGAHTHHYKGICVRVYTTLCVYAR